MNVEKFSKIDHETIVADQKLLQKLRESPMFLPKRP